MTEMPDTVNYVEQNYGSLIIKIQKPFFDPVATTNLQPESFLSPYFLKNAGSVLSCHPFIYLEQDLPG